MDFLQPTSWRDALEVRAERPEAVPISGGTDVMVELNFDRARPQALLDLSHVPELASWSRAGDHVWIGAGVPYARIIDELGAQVPGLAMAARTVGSPQIRNRGTLGGNLGSASPAGDAHPPLLAADAEVVLDSLRGQRSVPIGEFFTGPKRNALATDELISGVRTTAARGPQQFSKVGPRNAMVIAVCAFSVSLDPTTGQVGTGIGSAGPTPLRAVEAERFLHAELDGCWDNTTPLPEATTERFGELVSDAASPVDDVRGSADYRRHALSVLARRTVTWVWQEHLTGRQRCA